jgi:hypothetical protein
VNWPRGAIGFLADVETFGRRNAQELLEKQPDLTRRLRVDAHALATLFVIAVALGIPPGAHEHEEVRLGIVTEQIAATSSIRSAWRRMSKLRLCANIRRSRTPSVR